MRSIIVGFVWLMSACGYPSLAETSDAGVAVDVLTPNPTFGTFVKVEFNSQADIPSADLAASSSLVVDTDTSVLCDAHNNQALSYCVIVARNITISQTGVIRATGSKPLVLLATSQLSFDGIIDVSSELGGSAGAGSLTACTNTLDATGASGGYGGSGSDMGGDGEAISSGQRGRAAPLHELPPKLTGGCPGGGGGPVATVGGRGGSGGGAVAIIAASVRMNGKINASGAGGTGGTSAQQSGGGGGGAGGMIVIDSPAVTAGAGSIWLFANGGGGGQGGTATGLGTGSGANGGEATSPVTNVSGGNDGNHSGGSGGDGSAGVHTRGEDGGLGAAENSGGGGGGGGAAGFILSPPIANAQFAPPLITL